MSAITRSISTVGLLGLLGASAVWAQAPNAASASLSLEDKIPFDASVRTGTLPNGLTYFIRQNGRPANRVALRLAVKAGSLFEADDQQGLAHLIEHMAFNGSAHFKPGELVSYFESTGARLGPHVNAYTSFDETVYMLDLPTDSKDVVVEGAAGPWRTLPADSRSTRSRSTRSAASSSRSGAGALAPRRACATSRCRFSTTNRATPNATRSASRRSSAMRRPQRLRDFYDTWYRPERMAIIVVGDVKPEEIEAGIRDAFGPLKDRAPAAPLPDATVPLHTEDLVSVVSDPEVTSSSVQILHKRPADSDQLVGDYRRSIVGSLFSRMLNDRFTELARKPDAKFLSAGGGGGSLSPTVDTFGLNARVQDGGIADGLTALQIEARRVRQYGFTASELDRAKLWMNARSTSALTTSATRTRARRTRRNTSATS